MIIRGVNDPLISQQKDAFSRTTNPLFVNIDVDQRQCFSGFQIQADYLSTRGGITL